MTGSTLFAIGFVVGWVIGAGSVGVAVFIRQRCTPPPKAYVYRSTPLEEDDYDPVLSGPY